MEVTFEKDPNGTIVPRAIARPSNDQERLLFELWAAQLITADPAEIVMEEIIGDASQVFEGFSVGLSVAGAPADPFPVPTPPSDPDPVDDGSGETDG